MDNKKPFDDVFNLIHSDLYPVVAFLQDVIQAIKETAFVTSEYPVILSFENHCRCVVPTVNF